MASERVCCYCGHEDDGTPDHELRPYGPGGAWVCFPCMKADPEREKIAKRIFMGQMAAAEAMSPCGAIVLDAEGPQPFDAAQAAGKG